MPTAIKNWSSLTTDDPCVFDAVVIGAGVIGLMTAVELADAGLQVALLDQQQFGRESSWAGGGILAPLQPWLHPLPLHQLHLFSAQLYPQWIDRLLTETHTDPQYYACGMTVLQHGDAAVRLRQWTQTTPLLHEWQGDTLYWPQHANICNPQLLKGLKQLVQQHSAITCFPHTQVIDLAPNRVLTKQRTFDCEHIVMAAGAWTGVLAQRCGFDLDIFPVKGQMLLYEVPQSPLTQMRMVDDHYLIPRQNGQIIVGSTVEAAGFDVLPSQPAYAQLKQAAENLYSPLINTPILAQWSGLRPGSAQPLPMIGVHPQHKNLWINSGHFRNGLCLAPASAKLLAQQLLGQTTTINAQAFQLGNN